jgi:hypothetical protein
MRQPKNVGIIEDGATLMCYPNTDTFTTYPLSECKYATQKHPMAFSAAIKNVKRITIFNPKSCRNVQWENGVLKMEGEFVIKIKEASDKMKIIEVK